MFTFLNISCFFSLLFVFAILRGAGGLGGWLPHWHLAGKIKVRKWLHAAIICTVAANQNSVVEREIACFYFLQAV